MKQNTHTPGPWTYHPATRAIVTVPNKHGEYATIGHISESLFIDDAEHARNARLIAAAPALLAALEAALHALETPGDFTADELVAVQADAIDAIASARGEG